MCAAHGKVLSTLRVLVHCGAIKIVCYPEYTGGYSIENIVEYIVQNNVFCSPLNVEGNPHVFRPTHGIMTALQCIEHPQMYSG